MSFVSLSSAFMIPATATPASGFDQLPRWAPSNSVDLQFPIPSLRYVVLAVSVSEKLERAMPSLNLESRSHSVRGTSVMNSPPDGTSWGTSDAGSARHRKHTLRDDEDEDSAIRRLLRPPPIPGSEDGEYDIPPRPDAPCDPELDAKVMKFHLLKRQGKHFNDTLMQNKAFRNPHIYAKLVEFVFVDETGSNFPKDLWDPFDVREEWYAEKIAAQQKERSEKLSAAQTPGARTRIAFESSSTSNSKGKEREKDSRRSHHPYRNQSEERTRERDRDRPRDRERGRDDRDRSSHHKYHSERR
ncbi:hypothetical protein FRC04_009592 [Tulasnella sp. 424]|nr:hypothetical protein FRC04_009592 [Tulasnella sp. 424]